MVSQKYQTVFKQLQGWHGGATSKTSNWRVVVMGLTPSQALLCSNLRHPCVSVAKQYNLALAKWQQQPKAGKIIDGLRKVSAP